MSSRKAGTRWFRTEQLEDRCTPSAGLSPQEQYFLQLINRGRSDPAAEAARFGIDLNEGLAAGTLPADAAQPLAANTSLQTAIEGQLAYLASTGTFSHVGPDGSLPWDRTTAAGYPSTFVAENLAYQTGPMSAAALDNLYRLLFVDSGVDGRGHRVNMLSSSYREIGSGVTTGLTASGPQGVIVGQDYGVASGRPLLTGVAYSDTVIADHFYSIGEGLGGLTVTALSRGGLTYTTTTDSSGGYEMALPPGEYTVTFSTPSGQTSAGFAATIGSLNVQLDYTGSSSVSPPIVPPSPPPPPGLVTGTVPSGVTNVIAVGSDVGGPGVGKLVNPSTGATYLTYSDVAFGSIGGMRVVAADFTGDGVPDLGVGTGQGRSSEIKIINGATGAVVYDFAPFEVSFTGGVFITAGDLNGDGKSDLIVTPDEGGGPRVRVFAGGTYTPMADFFGIDDPNFRGGARAAAGDLNGDGRADLVVAAGFGGGPRLAVFDGMAVGQGRPEAKLTGDFFAFESSVRNGAYVTVADVDGDGFGDIIAGGGPGGGPRVRALSGHALLTTGTEVEVANYFAGSPDDRGGVRVTARDLNGDGRAEIITGAGPGGAAVVDILNPATQTTTMLSWPDIFDGVYVG
ncbi:MAG TPA: FG-GAP-like repeat-containing protein [Fimbriiglobus sp.]|jgi:uncharacterized protein YkwD